MFSQYPQQQAINFQAPQFGQYQSPYSLSQNNAEQNFQPQRNFVQNQSPYRQGGLSQNNFNQQTPQNQTNDDYIQQSLKQGAQVSELELILEGERRKNKENRDKLENELSQERKCRVEYENKLIRLKDESQKRELYLSELEYRVGTLQQENQGIVGENHAIKDEMLRMQELYNQKIRELEEKLQKLTRQIQSTEERQRQEYDQYKQNCQQELEEYQKQNDYKYKSLEEKCRNLMQIRNEMENEIRQMNDQFMKLKIEAEEELRERVVRVQEDEYRKYQSSLRNIEQRLKQAEETKDTMTRKNQQLVKDIQEKDNMVNDQYMAFDQEISKYKSQIGELLNNLNMTNSQRDKALNQLGQADHKFQRLEAEFQEFQRGTQRNKETLQRQIEDMSKEFIKEKRAMEDLNEQQARKLNEIKGVMKQLEGENERIRGEYDRTISQTVSENVSFRPSDMPNKAQFGYKYE